MTALDTGVQAGPSLHRVTDALEAVVGAGKRAGGAWTKFCCPVHENDGRPHHPSLIVKYLPDQQRTKVACKTGCDDERVLDAIGLRVRDLYDNPQRGRSRTRGAQRPPRREPSRADLAIEAAGLPLTTTKPDRGRQLSRWELVETYPYTWPDGTVAGEVLRRQAQFERGRDKDFRQRAWTEKGWEYRGFEPIPFELPRVLDAIESGEPIYVVEGEKDVLAAERAGLTATCNAGGAGGWTRAHAGWLAGAQLVVIVADRDAPGYRRAEKVADSLAGLADRVRIVVAATGKDLADHLQAGHEIADMEPIPGLDPYTPLPPARPRVALTTLPAATPAAGATPERTPGGSSVPESLMPPLLDQPVDTTPDIDMASVHWQRFAQLLMQQMILLAQKTAAARMAAAERAAADSAAEAAADAARVAVERKAIETRLTRMADRGWDAASRTEIAEAVRDAAAWAPDSTVATDALAQLRGHVHTRWGLALDPATGQVRAEVPAELADALTAAEAERASAARARLAGDRMVEAIADTEGLSESDRQALYAEVTAWQRDPSAAQLAKVTKALETRKAGDEVRTRVRFIAAYLGPDATVPLDQLDRLPALSPSTELRKMAEPLVDLGEEAKPRVDHLLQRYQDQVRHGLSTDSVREQLAETVSVMTAEDQQAARDRGVAIRKEPTQAFKPLWPDHVDRDALAADVRTYAALAPQVERQAAGGADLDQATAAGLREQAGKARARIQAAIKTGKGLHDLERDQLVATLRDIDSGVQVQTPGVRRDVEREVRPPVPEMLFVDDRSAAAVDTDRATDVAHTTSLIHRRQLDQILSSGAVPDGATRTAHDDITRVFDGQTHLAAGRWSLPDYEQRGLDAKLAARLTAAGVPEPIRNRVAKHLDNAAGEAAIAGKQAARIADRWADRRRAVVTARAAKPEYDSPQRRAQLAEQLTRAGLTADEVTQRIAADRGAAKPAAEATRSQGPKGRQTRPGAGVARTQHRGRGKGDRGLGLG